MSDYIIETKEATIRFGGLVAVDSVNLAQKKGEILSLIGPNGAGKTTLFNLLTGVYKVTSGSIFFDGKNITKVKAYERNRLGIARTFQNIRLIKSMTVLENVLIAHRISCSSPHYRRNLLIFFFGSNLKSQRNCYFCFVKICYVIDKRIFMTNMNKSKSR